MTGKGLIRHLRHGIVVIASCLVLAAAEHHGLIQFGGVPIPGRHSFSNPGRIDYSNVSLKDIIRQAYKVKDYQITAPSWMDSERYDVVAKLPQGASNEEVPAMVQNLLVERFQLKFRKESKEFPEYALVIGKNGPRLERADDADGKSGGGSIQTTDGKMEAKRVYAFRTGRDALAFCGSSVVDMTNTPGYYNFTLETSIMDLKKQAAMRQGAAGGAGGPKGEGGGMFPESDPSASIFTALQQLGLKMEPRKAPLEFLVIEKAERVPSEN